MVLTNNEITELKQLRQENRNLEMELKETNDTLNLALQIIAQNGKAHIYKEIIKGTFDVPEYEWPSFITNRLLNDKARNEEYLNECKFYADAFKDDIPFDAWKYVRYVNSIICTSFSYSRDCESLDMLGFISNKKGVCAQFAQFFFDMLSLKNIDCKIWNGYARDSVSGEKERHAYNSYVLDNKEYWADTTWNLCNENKDEKEKYLRMSEIDCARHRQNLYFLVK